MKLCSWCDSTFRPTVSYQIYCSPECRTQATKEKILERHKVLRRQKRKDKQRVCAAGCGTILSMYNDSKYCDNCIIHQSLVDKKLKEIRGLME